MLRGCTPPLSDRLAPEDAVNGGANCSRSSDKESGLQCPVDSTLVQYLQEHGEQNSVTCQHT